MVAVTGRKPVNAHRSDPSDMVMLTSMILRAAALLAKPSPCVHDLATPRPQLHPGLGQGC